MYRGSDGDSRDFGREAIDMLIAEMENHRNDLVVIMAGYTDEMETLMKANVGLESRMPYLIEFPNYTREQLFEIFMRMVGSIKYTDDFKAYVKEYFDTLSDEIITAKTFSNARFVRNLFEKTCAKAGVRKINEKNDALVLTAEDFKSATDERVFAKLIEKKKKSRIGF